MYCRFSYYNFLITLLLFTSYFCTCNGANRTKFQIMFFEFGALVPGHQVSYAFHGFIPPFTPVYVQNVTPYRTDLERRYTYLRVEYVSPLSRVGIVFDPETLLLTFHIRFPFLNIPFGIVGYSVKPLRSKVWDSWRRSGIDDDDDEDYY